MEILSHALHASIRFPRAYQIEHAPRDYSFRNNANVNAHLRDKPIATEGSIFQQAVKRIWKLFVFAGISNLRGF